MTSWRPPISDTLTFVVGLVVTTILLSGCSGSSSSDDPNGPNSAQSFTNVPLSYGSINLGASGSWPDVRPWPEPLPAVTIPQQELWSTEASLGFGNAVMAVGLAKTMLRYHGEVNDWYNMKFVYAKQLLSLPSGTGGSFNGIVDCGEGTLTANYQVSTSFDGTAHYQYNECTPTAFWQRQEKEGQLKGYREMVVEWPFRLYARIGAAMTWSGPEHGGSVPGGVVGEYLWAERTATSGINYTRRVTSAIDWSHGGLFFGLRNAEYRTRDNFAGSDGIWRAHHWASGRFASSELHGWVTFETLSPFYREGGETCPRVGRLRLSSHDNELIYEIHGLNATPFATLLLDGIEVASWPDCTAIMDEVAGASYLALDWSSLINKPVF